MTTFKVGDKVRLKDVTPSGFDHTNDEVCKELLRAGLDPDDLTVLEVDHHDSSIKVNPKDNCAGWCVERFELNEEASKSHAERRGGHMTKLDVRMFMLSAEKRIEGLRVDLLFGNNSPNDADMGDEQAQVFLLALCCLEQAQRHMAIAALKKQNV